MKKNISILFLFFSVIVSAQHGPPTDCVCNGSTAGKGKFYLGAGPDFHLGLFENDDRKYSLTTLGARIHAGYNFNKNFAVELIVQKYAFASVNDTEKNISSSRYSYLDFDIQLVYRFVKRGSRFVPYIKGGYLMNNTLNKSITNNSGTTEEKGFHIQGNYIDIGGGTLFILANQFTLFTETHLAIHPTVFQGLYSPDVFKMKPQFSVGVNYHF